MFAVIFHGISREYVSPHSKHTHMHRATYKRQHLSPLLYLDLEIIRANYLISTVINYYSQCIRKYFQKPNMTTQGYPLNHVSSS